MTVNLRLQRRGGMETGRGAAGQARGFMPTTVPRPPSCLKSGGPPVARWPNRDPLGEPGFELLRGNRARAVAPFSNLYRFVGNYPLNDYDPEGLDAIDEVLKLIRAVEEAS
jgi:hypothetical protein